MKENMDGFYRGLCHVLLFAGPQPVVQKALTVLWLHINNAFARKKSIAKKVIQTIRATMISQDIDLVAGDFNGTAWRCRNRDNLSTIDEVFDEISHLLSTVTRRTSSRLFRCVMFACAPLPLPFSPLFLLQYLLSHGRLGLPMEALLDTGRRLIQEGLSRGMGLPRS